jgi:anti-sigma factor RsiW
MKCDRIRELIMTVYVDGEASDSEKRLVEEHMASCEACRAFHRDVVEKAVTPLRESGVLELDEAVWVRIKERIGRKQEVPLAGVLEKLRRGLIPERPAFALVSVAALLVAGILVWSMFGGKGMSDYLEDQIYFVNSLVEEENGSYIDLGIPGEDYFL